MAKKTIIFLDTIDGLTRKTLVMTTANGTKLYFSPKKPKYLTSNWEDVLAEIFYVPKSENK